MIFGKTIKVIRVLVLLFSIFLAGCAVGPDFQKPVVETPDLFRAADEQVEPVVNLKWWELFNDPVLVSLVDAALSGNKNVMIAASRLEEARASLGFTKADQYPRLDLEADVTRGNMAGRTKVDSTDNNFFIGPVLGWELDFWGKYRRATEAARADLMASEYSLRTVQISLISEVVGTYFILLDFQQRLALSRQTLDSRNEGLDIIEKRFARGIIPELDVNQAQIQKEIAAAAIPVYERSIYKTQNTLSILLGSLPREIKSGLPLYKQTIPPNIPVGLPSSLLERRPDILQAESLLEAQNARIGVAVALRFPSISLTGALGAASDDLSDLTSDGAAWSVSAGLFGPIFNFNQDKMRVEIEKERTKQALYNYENTVLIAFKEVEDALNEVHTYRTQVSAVEKQFKAAKNAARLSKLRYDKGVTSYLEVLDSERTLFSAGLDFSDVKQQYYNAYVKLYKSLGGGWLSREEMKKTQTETVPEK